jgi:hypothetical protein
MKGNVMGKFINRWQGWASMLLGGWLVLSPAAMDDMFNHVVRSNAAGVGVVLITFNLISVGRFIEEGQEIVNILVGAWLIASPFALNFAGDAKALINAMAVGSISIILAFWQLRDATSAARARVAKGPAVSDDSMPSTHSRAHFTPLHYVILVFLVLILLMLAPMARAQDEMQRMPFTEAANGISYVTGGIGQDQQLGMKEARVYCNLRLTFAAKGSGEYLADVHLYLRGAKGEELLNVDAAGPLFYVHVPAGKYVVVVERKGRSQTRTLSIAKDNVKDLYFYWDEV